MKMKETKVMLLDEPPLVVQKSLGVALGLNKAIFLQQLHFMVSRYGKEDDDGVKWLRWSLTNWKEKVFPFWSTRTIQRIMREVESRGWMVISQEAGSTPRYRVDHDALYEWLGGCQVVTGECQSVTPSDDNVSRGTRQVVTPVPPIESSRETSKKKGEGKSPSVFSEDGKKKSPEVIKRDIRAAHQKKFRRNFEKSASAHSVEKLWEIFFVEHHGRKAYIPLTAADKRNVKTSLLKFCEAADVNLIDFMEDTIAQWEDIRSGPLKWAKLSQAPTFRAFFGLKDKFLEAYKGESSRGGDNGKKKVTVFYDINEVPRDHPQYKELALAIKHTGKATLR
jgi:hypothetical protein